jgi:hypothetical protein
VSHNHSAASLHKVVIKISILPYHRLNNLAKYFLGQWAASLHKVVKRTSIVPYHWLKALLVSHNRSAASLHKVVVEVSLLRYHWLNSPAEYFLNQ